MTSAQTNSKPNKNMKTNTTTKEVFLTRKQYDAAITFFSEAYNVVRDSAKNTTWSLAGVFHSGVPSELANSLTIPMAIQLRAESAQSMFEMKSMIICNAVHKLRESSENYQFNS